MDEYKTITCHDCEHVRYIVLGSYCNVTGKNLVEGKFIHCSIKNSYVYNKLESE
jgi:hypothetical protein